MTRIRAAAWAAVVSGVVGSAAVGQPLGTGFLHGGDLGAPLTGTYDLRFRLFDAPTGGAQQGPTLCANDVSVTDGAFSAELDFGAVFGETRRYLEIEQRADTGLTCSDESGYVTLSPRRELLAVPTAMYAMTAGNATTLNGQGPAFYQNASNLTSGTIPAGRLGGTYTTALTLNNAGNVFAGSGAGLTGLNAANVSSGTLSSARLPVPLVLSAVSPNWLIRAQNTSTVFGTAAIKGESTSAAGTCYGVFGESASVSGRGVFGKTTTTTGLTYGVLGQSLSNQGRGVYGTTYSTTGLTYGGYFESVSSEGVGVYGRTTTNTGNTRAVMGENPSPTGFAGFFVGARNYFSGRVGIGTQNPATALDVVGAVSINGVTVIDANGAWVGSGGMGGWTASGGNLTFTTGNVGVGTATPAHRLHVLAASGNGLFARAAATSGAVIGVSGESNSPDGFGVLGKSTAATGAAVGVSGDTSSTSGVGVLGLSRSTSGSTIGVKAEVASTSGMAVVARNTATSGATARGVFAETASTAGAAVFGHATSNSGSNAGVIGRTNSLTNGWGVYAEGHLGASGLKAFHIDHPLDPANKYLNHFSAEGPEALLIYRGGVVLDAQGEATVELPAYFEAINREFQYQLTPVGGAAPMLHVAAEVNDNRFSIAGGTPGLKVSWTVTGVRNDAFARRHARPVEEPKVGEQVGTYLHPDLIEPSVGHE